MRAEFARHEVEIGAKVEVFSQKVTIVSETVKVTEQLLKLMISDLKRFLLAAIDQMASELKKYVARRCD